MTSILGRDTARPITPHSILVAQLQKTLRMAEHAPTKNRIPRKGKTFMPLNVIPAPIRRLQCSIITQVLQKPILGKLP
ncbi:hypothetical protein [Nostoc favosum]|uniref:hypothetical protein n=1 Tax=Nostoc favosum TaxID=2907819 RepID=UPI003F68A9A4